MIILIPPNYQKGFEGFLRCAYNNGDKIITTSARLDFIENINSISWKLVLHKFDRAALWMPSIYKLYRTIKASETKEVHLVGEPTYLSNISIYFAFVLNRITPNWTCRVAQNLAFPMPIIFWACIYLFRRKNNLAFPVSKISKKLAENHYGINKTQVLPNGVPEAFYLTPIKTNKRYRVTFIGNFYSRKGIDDFLKISNQFKNSKKIKFTAIGGDVETIAQLSKTYDHVDFVKKIERERLIDYLDQSIALLVCSKKTINNDLKGIKKLISVPWAEQFGRVIIESYSRGTNVIAYDSGAISEVVIDKQFLSVEGDTNKMKNTLHKYIKSLKYTDQEFVATLVNYSKQFKWNLIYKRFLEIRNGFY